MSENITWVKRKSFSDGNVSLSYKRFLGYEKEADRLPQIVESEAVIVWRIYNEFLEGKTPYNIALRLTAEGVPTPGGFVNWRGHTVQSILTNEKYKDDAIPQKTFTVDFLTRQKKVNAGEVPQYYIEHSHPAIIRPEVYEMVQEEFRRRRELSSAIAMCAAKRVQITGFLAELKKHDVPLLEFDERVWQAALHHMKVFSDCKVLFVFRDGTELPWTVECGVRKYAKTKPQ